MSVHYHWSLGSFSLAPAGLRDAVLRVSCLTKTAREEFANKFQPSQMKTVARWSLGIDSTIEQWNELLKLFKIK